MQRGIDSFRGAGPVQPTTFRRRIGPPPERPLDWSRRNRTVRLWCSSCGINIIRQGFSENHADNTYQEFNRSRLLHLSECTAAPSPDQLTPCLAGPRLGDALSLLLVVISWFGSCPSLPELACAESLCFFFVFGLEKVRKSRFASSPIPCNHTDRILLSSDTHDTIQMDIGISSLIFNAD